MSLEDFKTQYGRRAAQTIQEFCVDNGVSRSSLYNMWGEGIGPRFMRVGVKKLITAEAAAEWRAAREAASNLQVA